MTSTKNPIANAGPVSWVLLAQYVNIMKTDPTKLAQQSISEEKRSTKKEIRWHRPGPSLAFIELSNLCKEEISLSPNLSLPLLGNSEAARTVRGSQKGHPLFMPQFCLYLWDGAYYSCYKST